MKSKPDLAILVPVLGRPHRVEALLESVRETTPGATVLFIADREDADELRALGDADAAYITPGGSYSAKISAGVAATTERLIFTGADDLRFYAGWFETAGAWIEERGYSVVGVNDLLARRREHATHFLMTRVYAEQPVIDGGPGPFHHGYEHWYCDDELIATARKRSAYVYAEDAHVAHLHPMDGITEDDDTYRKGRAHRRQDRVRFEQRSPLWT